MTMNHCVEDYFGVHSTGDNLNSVQRNGPTMSQCSDGGIKVCYIGFIEKDHLYNCLSPLSVPFACEQSHASWHNIALPSEILYLIASTFGTHASAGRLLDTYSRWPICSEISLMRSELLYKLRKSPNLRDFNNV